MTIEKSEKLATQINDIKMILYFVDVEYAKEAVVALRKQANFEDSAAVLNPRYNPKKTQCLFKQANMLELLVDFIELGKKVDLLKLEILKDQEANENIMKMFL